MKAVLIDLHYLPSIEYFCVLLKAEVIILERHEHFVKQTYRNRCYINTAGGIQPLIVPVAGKQSKIAMKDVLIDYHGHWQRQHWGAIQAAYGSAPFFAHYEASLHQIIFGNYPLLYDLNRALLSLCLKWLSYNPSMTETTNYERCPSPAVTDLRSAITPKVPYNKRCYYTPVPYQQVFGNKFAGSLSLIDLLMCQGPYAADMVRSSIQAD